MAQHENKPWKDAIVEVLKGSTQAMHYADIATEIQKRHLRSKVGATPAATVNVVIHESIQTEGKASPFLKVGIGDFLLKSKLPTAKDLLIQASKGPSEP